MAVWDSQAWLPNSLAKWLSFDLPKTNLSLFHLGDGRPLRVAEWCRLDQTWPAVIAATVAHWLRHDNR